MRKPRKKKNKLNQKNAVAKPHDSVVRSQLQVISQLTSEVNKIADINAKILNMEEKD